MKTWLITGPHGLTALEEREVPEPTPGSRDILIDMHAWSLNFRDLSMPYGGYPGNDKPRTNPPMVPLSDGAGTVIAVGKEVSRFRVGDRVMGSFFQSWISGELADHHVASALGGARDGLLAERVVLHEAGAVAIPHHLDFAQAATLPCAALTAWQALTWASLKPGDSILALGTGGVSIFALQFAKLSGARVFITSSSDEKLERARALGADETINYRTHPEWDQVVIERTQGRGVDNVIEVGGAGTLAQSLRAARTSGTVSLIGVLTGRVDQNPSPLPILFKRLRLQGIYVGSRDMFEDMNRAITLHRLQPVIDRVFSFDDVPAAYQALQSATHFGKIVIQRN